MKVVTKCNGVPNADDFNVEEEWLVACLPSSTKSCILRISSLVVFEKFSMMNKIIQTNHDKENGTFWTFFKEILTKNDVLFK